MSSKDMEPIILLQLDKEPTELDELRDLCMGIHNIRTGKFSEEEFGYAIEDLENSKKIKWDKETNKYKKV